MCYYFVLLFCNSKVITISCALQEGTVCSHAYPKVGIAQLKKNAKMTLTYFNYSSAT